MAASRIFCALSGAFMDVNNLETNYTGIGGDQAARLKA